MFHEPQSILSLLPLCFTHIYIYARDFIEAITLVDSESILLKTLLFWLSINIIGSRKIALLKISSFWGSYPNLEAKSMMFETDWNSVTCMLHHWRIECITSFASGHEARI